MEKKLGIILGLYTIAILALGFLYIRNQERMLLRQAQERLERISDYKASEIQNWISERRHDAIVFGSNDIFRVELNRLMASPQSQGYRDEVLSHFTPLVLHYGFEDILLVDSAGRIYASIYHSQDSIGIASRAMLQKTFKQRNYEFSGFYFCDIHQKVHVDFYTPLLNIDKNVEIPRGMVLLRVDPAQYLFPLLKSWPIPSKTSESVIAEVRNDSIHFLNESQHDKSTFLTSRSASDPDLPVALDSIGKDGFIEITGYHGILVMAFLQKIEGTPWYIFSKTDRSEILEPMRSYWIRTLLAAFFMLLLGMMVVFLISSMRKREALKNLYQLEKERNMLARHYELILKNANDIIFLSDPQGTIKDCNDKALSEYGYSRDELIGKSITMLLVPEEGIQYTGRMEKLWQENSNIFETTHVRKNGSRFPVEVSMRSFQAGDQVHVQGIIRNISERKLVEQALSDSEKRYRLLFHSMTEGFALHEMVFDQSGHPVDYMFLEINPSFEKLTGLTGESILGKRVTEVLPTIQHSWIDRYGKVVVTGDPVNFSEYSKELDRTYKIIAFRPQPGQFAVIIEDISESVKKTELIEKMNQELEMMVQSRTAELLAANKELESFSYSVSHDLRAPLRGMDGFSLALLEDFETILPDKAKEYLNKIRKASQRMGELIDELLKLSRINRLSPDIRKFDLSSMVQGICNELTESWKEYPYNLSIEEGIMIEADPGLFKIAMANLLHNAFKFSHKTSAPEIVVRLVQHNNRKELMVQDNGAGFDMRYVDKIFGPFQRLHTTDEFPGTGIGLTIVARIINRHGGVISAESKPGEGASFFIWVPGLVFISDDNL